MGQTVEIFEFSKNQNGGGRHLEKSQKNREYVRGRANIVKIKYARPKILAGHLVGSRGPKMARGHSFGITDLVVLLCNHVI